MQLKLKDVCKSFGEKEVLKGISFTADGGKAFGLLGRNGAGKTTTIRIIMDVFKANSGEVLIDGKPINRNEIKIGYLPEERGLYAKKKIQDQLVYFAELNGLSKFSATKSVEYWLSRLGMSEYANKRLDTLSKGNQQKIQLITALAHDPDIVILDEPFSGLDPVNAMLLKDVVNETIERGKIVLFSSHQMSYIEEFCSCIAILNGGKIVLSGEINEIKRNYPRTRLVVRSTQNQEIYNENSDNCIWGKNGEILLKLNTAEEKMSVIKSLSDKYDIDEIKVYEPSLNDIFVEYTEKQI